MGKRKPTMPPSEALLHALKAKGETMYRIAEDSGVPYAIVFRFMSGQRAVSLDVFDKLCRYLGLELRERE
jgi:transcriptional regulator with XRE-family HTH domain